jgi:hypothetical protein
MTRIAKLENQAQITDEPHQGNSSMLARLYYSARIYLHKKRWLLRGSQVLRGLVILGPLRPYAIRYYRHRCHNRPLPVDNNRILAGVDVKTVVENLCERGFATVGPISAECVSQIVRYSEVNRQAQYWNPHNECEAIRQIAYNETILEIAKNYLGAEPVLWLSQLKWSFGDPSLKPQMLPPLYAEPQQYDSDAFHYDTLDYKSLTVFIYLTDVDADSGPHVAIEGSHMTKSLWELLHIILSDNTAERWFGNRIKMILGQKGTVHLEETSCFHKAARCKSQRLMLSIDYVLQRTPPPERPRVALATQLKPS